MFKGDTLPRWISSSRADGIMLRGTIPFLNIGLMRPILSFHFLEPPVTARRSISPSTRNGA
jgi:hypothetical protein